MTTSFLISINRTDRQYRKTSLILIGVAILCFWVLSFIQPFIQGITNEIFPRSITYGFISVILIGILSMILLGIKKNKSGILNMDDDSIQIESDKMAYKIYYKDLKRISFVAAAFSFKPYRIEFIYPDFQVTRIRLRTEKDFYEIMEYLYNVTPEELEKHVSSFESEDK
jgi:hypothetical protein